MFKDIIIPNLVLPNLSAQVVTQTLTEALSENEQLWKNNRQMLLDFYNSQQTDQDGYLKKYFNVSSDPIRAPDYPHNLVLAQLNWTAKLIDKKAKTYKRQPIRLIDAKPNDEYNELLDGLGIKSTSKMIDRMTWLLGDVCIVLIADADKETVRLDIPPYYRPFFSDLDKINPIGVIYPVGLVKIKEEWIEAWQYWDEENSILFEHGTWAVLKQEDNPHGIFNALFTHRQKPLNSHWTRDAQDLIDTNRDINIALTTINNALRYHGFPILALMGIEESDAKTIKIRFDKALTLSPGAAGTSVDARFLYPNVDWNGLTIMLRSRFDMLAASWNVHIKWEGDIMSGVALEILNMDNREDIVDMQELYEEFFETPLLQKLQQMSDAVSWLNVPKGDKLTLDWQEEEFIETPSEHNARIKERIELNLTNPIDELKAENPDLDDAAAVKQYMRNVRANSVVAKIAPAEMDETKILAILDRVNGELGTAGLMLPLPEDVTPAQ